MRLDKKLKISIVASFAIFVFMNLLIFLIPFPHGAVFWSAYAFLMASLVVNAVVIYLSASQVFLPKKGISYYPLLRIGSIYLIVQGIVSLVFFIADYYMPLILVWIPIVLSLVIFGVAVGLLIAAYSGIKIVEDVGEKTKEATSFITVLITEMDILRNQVSDTELKMKLNSLYETIRFSDPVSASVLADVEGRIREELNMLKAAVTLQETAKAEESIQKLTALVYERNQKCKLSK